MALGFTAVFQSNCTGFGYWTHFFCGAAVGSVQLVGFRWLTKLLWLLLIAYQVTDYFIGNENQLTAEGALARDVGEYIIGYTFVIWGAALERRRSTQQKQQ